MLTGEQIHKLLAELPWPKKSRGPDSFLLKQEGEHVYTFELVQPEYLEESPRGLRIVYRAYTSDSAFRGAVEAWCRGCAYSDDVRADIMRRVNNQTLS